MIKAEVVTACRIDNMPKKPGDIVEIDEATFNRLVRQGVLKLEGAKAMKIVRTSALVAELKPKVGSGEPPIPAAPKPKGKPQPDGGFRVH